MRRYLFIDWPMTSEQASDAVLSGVTKPRRPVTSLAKALLGFDGDIPDSFSAYEAKTWEECASTLLTPDWKKAGF